MVEKTEVIRSEIFRSPIAEDKTLTRDPLIHRSNRDSSLRSGCFYRIIPGSFIPANLRLKLDLPMSLNILRIWAY